jgi:hypothetical protein
MGETLIIPLRNSINVPLISRSFVQACRGKKKGRLLRLPFDGNIQVGNVMEDETDELLVLVLADVFDKRL